MDALIVAAGIVVGTLTGLVPGLHVNLLAAVALTIPGIDAGLALGLVAVGTVHTFVTILPTTYLGAPGDDTALAMLPAHRLRNEGAGPEAVRISLAASMLAAIAAIAALWPFRWLLLRPEVPPFLALAAPVVLVAVPAWFVWRDERPAAAAGTAGLAALLGHLSWDWPVHGWVPGAASPLLPLLSGLFGVPTLLWAIRQRGPAPWQAPPPPRLAFGTRRSAMRGVGAAAFTAVLPGLTAAVATSIAMPRRRDPRQALSTLSAVNTAHATFALCILWITGQTRSGLAIAWAALQAPTPWIVLPPRDLLAVTSTVLFAGACAVFLTIVLERPYVAVLRRIRPGVAEASTLALLTLLVTLTTGPSGLLLFATATAVGIVPLRAGVRRIHLAASLSIPIAIRLATA